MNINFRKVWSKRYGPFAVKLNATKTGTSWTKTAGPVSHNSKSGFSINLPGPFFWKRGRIGWRKSFTLGIRYLHFRIMCSRAGVSWSAKVGPYSWTSRGTYRIDGPGPISATGRTRPAKRSSRSSR
jgi:hypothetical protein